MDEHERSAYLKPTRSRYRRVARKAARVLERSLIVVARGIEVQHVGALGQVHTAQFHHLRGHARQATHRGLSAISAHSVAIE